MAVRAEQLLATTGERRCRRLSGRSRIKVDATLVHISTDYVFDGKIEGAYAETNRTNPQSVYGQSKLLGEQAVVDSPLEKYFIVRTSWLYGPGGNNFVETICDWQQREKNSGLFLIRLVRRLIRLIWPLPFFVYLQLLPVSSHQPPASMVSTILPMKAIAAGTNLPARLLRKRAIESCLLRSELKPIRTEDYPLPANVQPIRCLTSLNTKLPSELIFTDWRDSLRTYLHHEEIRKFKEFH